MRSGRGAANFRRGVPANLISGGAIGWDSAWLHEIKSSPLAFLAGNKERKNDFEWFRDKAHKKNLSSLQALLI